MRPPVTSTRHIKALCVTRHKKRGRLHMKDDADVLSLMGSLRTDGYSLALAKRRAAATCHRDGA